MTRPEKIISLRLRYAQLTRARQFKAAHEIHIELRKLMVSQLRSENRSAA